MHESLSNLSIRLFLNNLRFNPRLSFNIIQAQISQDLFILSESAIDGEHTAKDCATVKHGFVGESVGLREGGPEVSGGVVEGGGEKPEVVKHFTLFYAA